jgi:type I restriction enzyme S subunit
MSATPVELGSVARVLNGKTPSKKEQRSSGFPVLKIKDVGEFGQFRGIFDSFVDADLADAFPEKIIQQNDVLLLNAAHNADYVASKSFFVEGSAVGALATGEWLIVRADRDKLDSKFMSFWLETPSIRARIAEIVRGIHLYPTDMAELAICLPSLAEQQRIAKQLQEADNLRRVRRYALQMCDELLASAFVEMFGDPVINPQAWPTDTLDSVSTTITDGEHLNPKFVSKGFPIVMAEQVEDSGVNLNSCKIVSPEDFTKFTRKCEPKKSDILLVSRGATKH